MLAGQCELPYVQFQGGRRLIAYFGVATRRDTTQRSATYAQSERNMIGEGAHYFRTKKAKSSLTFGVVIHTTTAGFRHIKSNHLRKHRFD